MVESESNCDFYHRLIGDFPHDPLSINGKTYPDYLALNKGYCWVTGNQLSYDFIKAVALKYKIGISLIEKFKININAEQTKIKV
ncbi:hypothetical protein Omtje5_4 [Cellulophaga phage Omtje_5]|nr:hypothetical protein Omtje5_4 [Cellulophaga phage Omtje_5]